MDEKILKEFTSVYENTIKTESKKKTGSFYTDRNIIRYMLKHTLEDMDIAANPYVRVLDPSCGCGYFLLDAYEILKKEFIEHIDEVNERNPGIKLTPLNIHDHIIENNIFGADIDMHGVSFTRMGLMLKEPKSSKIPNIICCDSIMDREGISNDGGLFWKSGFDIIVGNPPYIGHKKISGKYRKDLGIIYGDIFRDKADISFCFIKSSIDRLSKGGRLCFITSRYFMESPSGMALRNYIKQNCSIESIIDFYGVRIMKGISVDPVIVTFLKSDEKDGNMIKVSKAQISLKNIEGEKVFNELENGNVKYFSSFLYPQYMLRDEGWTLCPMEEMAVLKKIEARMKLRLNDVCRSFQGIITGCDSAFIVDEASIEDMGIERSITRRWIKNSCVKKYKVEESRLRIIYSDFIDEPVNYGGAISYIERYRERLENRRECKRGVRKWYQLQWGRDNKLFEGLKIVFPYKSSCNRFALDRGSYSSADVYGMVIRPEYDTRISYEYLLGILNSRLYEFYFKSFAKKLGAGLYDYYPNTLMRLMVPDHEDEYITARVKYILGLNDENKINEAMCEIDEHIYKVFNLSDSEIEIVDRHL